MSSWPFFMGVSQCCGNLSAYREPNLGWHAVERTPKAWDAVFQLALNRQVRVSKSPFSKIDRMENPTAEPKFGSLTTVLSESMTKRWLSLE